MTAITNYRILLIDDDTKFHQKMRSIFGKDYEFDGAIDEKKATEKLNTNQYDLIWLDLDLAYGDFRKGLENIKPFSELAKGAPVIVVSNDSRTSTVVDAIKEGSVYIENTSSRLTYGGAWVTGADSAPSGGTYSKTATNGDSVTIVTTQPMIYYRTFRYSQRSDVSVYVDGVLKTTLTGLNTGSGWVDLPINF